MGDKCKKCGELLTDHSYGLCPGSLSRIMSEIGKQAAGKPKNFSPEELKKRAERMKKINEKRRKKGG